VVLAGKTAPGGLDRSLAGAALHAEHVVRIAFGHETSVAGGAGRPVLAGRVDRG
jgi:hypothetical protein